MKNHTSHPASPGQNGLNSRPEFFRIPSHGPDPYFGLRKSYYYNAEARGDFRLVRLRERGKLRGVTLVPYDAVAAFIRSQAEADGPKEAA